MPARPIRSARDAPVAVVRMHMHTPYVFVRIFVRRGRRGEGGNSGTEGKSFLVQGVRLRRSWGCASTLVPMLSADIPRAIGCVRACGARDIIIAEPSVFPRRALGTHGKWRYHWAEGSDRVAWAIYV